MKLDEVRSILGARRLGEGLKHAAAEQLFFERPPVVEEAQLAGDAKAQVRVKYYDYGVVSVLFEFPFAGEWPDLISYAVFCLKKKKDTAADRGRPTGPRSGRSQNRRRTADRRRPLGP